MSDDKNAMGTLANPLPVPPNMPPCPSFTHPFSGKITQWKRLDYKKQLATKIQLLCSTDDEQ